MSKDIFIYLWPFDRVEIFSRKFICNDKRYVCNIPAHVGKDDVYYRGLGEKQYVPNAPEDGIFVASVRKYRDNYVLGDGFQQIALPISSPFISYFFTTPKNYFCKFVEEIKRYPHVSMDLEENIRVYFIQEPVMAVIDDLKEYVAKLREKYNRKMRKIRNELGIEDIEKEMNEIYPKIYHKDIIAPPGMSKRKFVNMLREKYGEGLYCEWILEYPQYCKNKDAIEKMKKYMELKRKYRELEQQTYEDTEDMEVIYLHTIFEER